jgi:hypothetical protein
LALPGDRSKNKKKKSNWVLGGRGGGGTRRARQHAPELLFRADIRGAGHATNGLQGMRSQDLEIVEVVADHAVALFHAVVLEE